MHDEAFFEALYASIVRDDSLQDVLALLAGRFGARAAALAYGDAGRPAADLSIGCGTLTSEIQDIYRERFSQQDPAPAVMMALPVGRAIATDRVFSEDFKAHSPFVQNFYHPHGFREALGGPVARDNGRFGMVVVLRGDERAAFSDADIADFERLMPHVARALGMRRAFFEMERKAELLETALDSTNLAILTFDDAGVLHHANLAARALLARGDGLVLTRAGRLTAQDATASQKLRLLFEGASPRSEMTLIAVPVAGRTTPYFVRAVVGTPAGEPAIILHVCDPAAVTGEGPGLLAAVLGVTPAAARLLAALSGGEDLNSYASRTGITVHTARFHLKALFAATGTSRQADVVRLATAILRDLGTNRQASLAAAEL